MLSWLCLSSTTNLIKLFPMTPPYGSHHVRRIQNVEGVKDSNINVHILGHRQWPVAFCYSFWASVGTCLPHQGGAR